MLLFRSVMYRLSGLICYGNTSILIEKGQKRPRMDAWESFLVFYKF